jgi:hypothetical protein
MAATNEFVLRIRADDKATATINRIKNSIAKFTDPVAKTQSRVSKLGDIGKSSLGKLEKSFEGVSRSALKVVDRIVEIIPGLTAIGGAASLAGLAAMTEKFGTFGFSVTKSSKLLGMSTSDLQAWHIAAKKAGMSADQFDQGMSGSQDAIRGAAYGANPEAMMYLNKMHVAIQRNQDGSINYLTTQERIMKALAAQKSVEGQRAAAGALGMSGMLPMIQRDSWDKDKGDAQRRGLVMSPEAIARADAFKRRVIDLQSSVEGFGNTIGDKLIPVLEPAVVAITKWLDDNKVQIAERLSAAVGKFVTWISSIDWSAVVSKASKFVDAIGGVKGVAIAIAAITFAGPLASIASLIASMVTLTRVIVPAAIGALGSLGVAAGLAYVALQVAKAAGLPDTDEGKGKDDIRKGNWLAASAHLPAIDFLKALAAKIGGQTDAQIAGAPAAAAPAGCASLAPGTAGADGAAAAPTATAQPSGDAAGVMSKLQALGWTRAQAAGIAANLKQESGFNPSIPGDNGAAYGIAQWHADRQDEFKKWAGHDIRGTSLDEQLQFLNYDLRQGPNRKAGDLLARQTTAEGAGRAVSQFYERPGDIVGEAALRGASANRLYAAAGGEAGGAGNAGGNGASGAPATAQVHVTFANVPPGTKVQAKSQDGGYLPTKVNYAMGTTGAMP